MISDEDLDSLPDDPDAAFVAYERIVRESLRVSLQNNESHNWDLERDYVAHILAFVDNHEILIDLPRQPPRIDPDFGEWYANFIRAVDYFKVSARLQISKRKKQNVSVLALSLDFKTQIGGHLTAIRKILADAQLTVAKREAIFRRVENLQEEVDRDRTRTEAAFALWLEITSAISKGAENLDPAIERMERIIKVFAKAKDEEETRALVSPKENKRLTAPTIPSAPIAAAKPKNSDDDIPF